jgi:hypothetical protein
MNDVHQPQKDESPRAGGLSNASEQKHEPNYTPINDEAKEFFTLRARLALVGHCLYQVKNDDHTASFLVTKWGMTRELKTLTDVSKFLAQIGGQK